MGNEKRNVSYEKKKGTMICDVGIRFDYDRGSSRKNKNKRNVVRYKRNEYLALAILIPGGKLKDD